MEASPNPLKRLIVPLAIVVVLFVFAVAALLIRQHVVFMATSTTPNVNKVSTVSPFFKVTFNQQLVPSSLSLKTSPDNLAGGATVSGKTLTVPLKVPLTAGKTYSITITKISAVNGKQIANKTYTFKPTYIASSDLSPEEQKSLVQREDIGGTADTRDPILQYLPYATTDFTLKQDVNAYKTPPPHFALYATILLSNADASNEAAATAKYEQEVRDYITSVGLNPDVYSITYDVQQP